MTQDPSLPDWYRKAIATPYKKGSIEVAGCNIHYQHWLNPNAPALLLIHGYAAHSHWWDFIAPLLLDQYQVVAIDISGCGESGHGHGAPCPAQVPQRGLHQICPPLFGERVEPVP